MAEEGGGEVDAAVCAGARCLLCGGPWGTLGSSVCCAGGTAVGLASGHPSRSWRVVGLARAKRANRAPGRRLRCLPAGGPREAGVNSVDNLRHDLK